MKKQFLLATTILFVGGSVLLTSCGKDEDVPVITLKGDASVSSDFGSTFTDPGATADDEKDGDLSASVTVTGTVNSSSAELYTLAYNVSDEAGNAAIEVKRTVNVVIKNSNMVGSYNCTDQVGSATPSSFTDNVVLGTTANSVKLPKFAFYTNTSPEVYVIIKGTNGTEIELPSQTVSANGANRTFIGSGSISKDAKVMTINYSETTNGTTVTGKNVYTKN